MRRRTSRRRRRPPLWREASQFGFRSASLSVVISDHAGAGACRRRSFHDLFERGVDGSPGGFERLVIVGALLSCQEARPGGLVGLQKGEDRIDLLSAFPSPDRPPLWPQGRSEGAEEEPTSALPFGVRKLELAPRTRCQATLYPSRLPRTFAENASHLVKIGIGIDRQVDIGLMHDRICGIAGQGCRQHFTQQTRERARADQVRAESPRRGDPPHFMPAKLPRL
jgi:hypothetical protein